MPLVSSSSSSSAAAAAVAQERDQQVASVNALELPTWQNAHSHLNARLDQKDPILAATHRRLRILAKLINIPLAPELLKGHFDKFLNPDKNTRNMLAAYYDSSRLKKWNEVVNYLLQEQATQEKQSPHGPTALTSAAEALKIHHNALTVEHLVTCLRQNRQLITRQGVSTAVINFAISLDRGDSVPCDVVNRALQYLLQGPPTIGADMVVQAICLAVDDIDMLSGSETRQLEKLASYYLIDTGTNAELSSSLKERAPVDTPQPVFQLPNMGETERARLCINAERVASDQIRSRVIPQLIGEQQTSMQSFFAIHRSRFSSAPAPVQNFGQRPFNLSDYTTYMSVGPLYQANIGRFRTLEMMCSGTFQHLASAHLKQLGEVFFSALDGSFETTRHDRDQAIEQLVLTQAFLTLAHFPFDGAGRTNEDFIVYCAKRLGIDLSLSVSGYRHHCSPLTDEFSCLETRFKHEYDRAMLCELGIIPSVFDESFWLNRVSSLVAEISLFGAAGCIVEKSLRSIRFIDALKGDAQARSAVFRDFPSLVRMKALFLKACSEIYSLMESEAGENLDLWMAKSLVTPPWQFRCELYCARETFPKDRISQAFLNEHLVTRRGCFVSERLLSDFDELRSALGPCRNS